jgi:hypothetical protein
MSDKPILFSGPMVRALLAGTKTQTRRALNPQPVLQTNCLYHVSNKHGGMLNVAEEDVGRCAVDYLRIAVGDRLYVREAWRVPAQDDRIPPRDLPRQIIGYEADYSSGNIIAPGRLRPGMHMPRWASRLTLTVTYVRVERLRDISEADAQAEGITRIGAEYVGRGSKEWERGPNFYQVDIGGGTMNDATAVALYMRLWDWINGDGSADLNPWVAAYTFNVERGNIDALNREEGGAG